MRRPVSGTTWYARAGVEVDGERLVYQPESAQQVRAGAGILQEFLALAEGTADHVARFAQRFGLLEICEHNLPRSHNPAVFDAGAGISGCHPNGWWGRPAVLWEPIERWRFYARQARAILRIAQSLRQLKVGPPEDWASLYAEYSNLPKRGVPWWKQTVGADQEHLADILNRDWLEVGDVRPRLNWSSLPGSKVSVELGGQGLFGGLATQLLFAVGQADGFAVCTICGQPYAPTRRPSPTRNNYCPTCRASGADVRFAVTEHRRKKAHSKGTTTDAKKKKR
jgi:hypothetical protein